MNASLYQLKNKLNEGTQGNRKWWLAAALVLLVALVVYAQVHNALGAQLSAAANTEEILLAGKKGRKRTFSEPLAAASSWARCAPSPTKTNPTPLLESTRAAASSVCQAP